MFLLISQKLMKILIPNFIIILRDIFSIHLFTGGGNRRVYTDSQRVVIGICGRRPLWQTTTIWHQNSLMAKCIIPILLFCQNLGQNGPVVQEKMPKKLNFSLQYKISCTNQWHLLKFRLPVNKWILNMSLSIMLKFGIEIFVSF